MRKVLLSLLIFVFSGLVHAESEQEQIIGPFGTLNNRDTAAAIADTQAQDLLNVDITPGGKSFKKRKGYGQSFATTITTSAMHGIYDFYDASGNDIALAFNDSYLAVSISGAAPSVLFSNGPLAATYQCTDSQGFAYCADTARDRIVKTNGVTTTSLLVVTTGTMITVTPDRLVQAGFAGAPSRIDFSASTDFTNWTTGVAATSPFQFTVTSPGSGVKHITYAFNRVMWFKDSSFGYILPGATAADWVIKTISPIIGTLDNASVYYQDILYFKSQDGNFYSYDGSSLQKISKEIAGTVALTQRRASNSWSQSTQGEWANGFDITSIYIDTATSSGDVQMTFPDNFNTFRNGTSSKAVWSSYCKGLTTCTTNVAAASGVLTFTSTTGVAGEDQMIRSTLQLNNYKVGTSFYFQISSVTAGTNEVFSFGISSYSVNTPITSALFNDQFFFDFKSTTSGRMYLNRVKDTVDGTICSGTCQTGDSVSTSAVVIFIATNTYQVSIGGAVVKSGSHSYANNQVFPYFDAFWGNVSTGTVSLDVFGVAPETATFYSNVKNAASLSAWDSFTATYQNNGGSNSFYIRSSTNPINVNSSTQAWTAIVPGATPSISTGTYFQIRDDFSISVATQSPVLNDFTQNWIEGFAADKSYATYFNDAIYFSVSYGAGASVNNRVLKYDLLNQGWLVYDLAVNGFYLKNLSLYFGSSTGGYVYKYGDTDNDNGAAINAYWKSKDFIGSDPFSDEEIKNISVFSTSVQNSSFTFTYVINGSSSSSFIIPSYKAGVGIFNTNKNLPLGTSANSFSIQAGNNAANQPFEIFAERVGYIPKTWKPTQ